MSLSSSMSRFAVYLTRNGLRATASRLVIAARRTLFSNRMVLFYCDLSKQSSDMADLPSSLRVERYTNRSNLNACDINEITGFWNPKLAHRNLEERFKLGASLWLIKCDDDLAGYGWSLQGCTVEPHYFALGRDDVHLFDFQVFPKYRGRGINPLLVRYILRSLARESGGRAFIEAAEWNLAQLASLEKTPFRHLDSARKVSLLGRTVVCWDATRTLRHNQEDKAESTLPTVNHS